MVHEDRLSELLRTLAIPLLIIRPYNLALIKSLVKIAQQTRN